MSAARKSSRGEPLHILQARLSLGLSALCGLAFIATSVLGFGAAERRDAALERAALHYREHPYLDAPFEILLEADEDNAPTFDAAQIAPANKKRAQAELDAILAEAEAAARETPAYQFGVAADAVSALRLALHVFVHAGLLHLLWTVGLLASAGARLESLLGRGLYAGLLFGSAASGAALHAFAAAPASAPLLGLTAASAGLVGAFAVRPGDVPRDPLAIIASKPRRSPLRAAALLSLVGASLCALAGASAPSFEPIGVLGGFGFGALAMFGFGRAGLVNAPEDARPSPEVAKALALLNAGDAAAAIESLRSRLSGGAQDPLAARALGLALHGRADARERLESALFGAIDANQREVAPELWRELAELGAAPRGRCAQLQTLAGWLRSAGSPGEARAALMAALADADAASAAQIARTARRGDPLLALRAAERALSFATLAAPERAALSELAAQTRKDALSMGVVPLDAALEAEAAAARAARTPIASPASRRGADPALIAGDERALDLEEPAPPQAAEPRHATPELTALDEAAPEPDPSADPQLFFERGAIDLTAEQPALELPDPEVAGEAALLDALHAALLLDDGGPAQDLAEPAAPAAPEAPRPAAPRADEFAFGAPDEADSLFELEKPEPAPPRSRPLRVSAATPLRLDESAIALDIAGRGRGKLAYAKIDAVSAAGVRGLSQNGKAVLLIDLAIGFAADEGELRIVRLRADGFDPRALVAGQTSPLAALRALVAELRARTRGVALPRESEPGAPFRIYADLASYEREAFGAKPSSQAGA